VPHSAVDSTKLIKMPKRQFSFYGMLSGVPVHGGNGDGAGADISSFTKLIKRRFSFYGMLSGVLIYRSSSHHAHRWNISSSYTRCLVLEAPLAAVASQGIRSRTKRFGFVSNKTMSPVIAREGFRASWLGKRYTDPDRVNIYDAEIAPRPPRMFREIRATVRVGPR